MGTRRDALLAGCFLLLLGQVCPCQASEGIPKECGLGTDSGPWAHYVSRIFFNPYKMKCEAFKERACGGNENQFFTIISCLEYCLPEKDNRKICRLPEEAGACRAFLPSWYYDPSSPTCMEFFYDGCGRNDNNFPDYEECEQACHKIKSIPKECQLDSDPGRRPELVKRYFFNPYKMKCELFGYSGCGGNENNFFTKISCLEYCLPGKSNAACLCLKSTREWESQQGAMCRQCLHKIMLSL